MLGSVPATNCSTYKLDGARVQIHRQDDEVRIYSRYLADITASLPDVVAQVRTSLAAEEVILDGAAIAVDTHAHPLPCQDLMRRFRRKYAVAATGAEVPVQLHLFDLLYLNGQSLLDSPYQARWGMRKSSRSIELNAKAAPPSAGGGSSVPEAAYQAGPRGGDGQGIGQSLHAGGTGKA
jgi:hypothetical protein